MFPTVFTIYAEGKIHLNIVNIILLHYFAADKSHIT